MMKKLIIIILVFGSYESNAGSFITVGADNDSACDYHNIQAAIDSDEASVIRIASNKNYFENIELLNSNNSLIGGYANCQMANLNITDLSQAIITGNGNDAVIEINEVLNLSYAIKIKNLIISNGGSGISARSQNNAQLQLTVDGVRLFNNTLSGFKISQINGGQADAVLHDVLIDFNENSGVYCEGENVNIRFAGTSVISNNHAEKGGAFSINNGCDVSVYSPTQVVDNEAVNLGGGFNVYNASLSLFGLASSCADGICFGIDNQPVTVRNNTAFSGGGIAVDLQDADVTIFNALIEGNSATIGGAITASQGSVFALTYLDGGNACWQVGRCNQFINNTATASGGSVFASNNATVEIYSTWFKGNRSDKGGIAFVSENSEVTINNSMIVKNGNNGLDGYDDENLFQISGGGAQFPNTALNLEYVTITDNKVTDEVINNSEGNIRLHSSIIKENVDVYSVINQVTAQFECLISHETSSFSAGGTVSIADPEFMNPVNDDYRIKPSSPAVDYCYEIASDWYSDLDWEEHGFDDPNKANLHGTYDLGADEYIIDNDIIFKNSFEQD